MESVSIRPDQRIAQGNTAVIYRLGDGKILKLFRDGIARSAIEREYQNSRIAAGLLPQVPGVFDMPETDGRLGIVFQEVQGTEMLHLMLADPLKLRRYAIDFAGYHVRITQPLNADMRTVHEKLRDEIGWQKDLLEEETRVILNMLSALPDGGCLCHCDFHPGNVMISDGHVYFLDWMTACRGDACADAARTCLLLKFGEPLHVSRGQWLLVCAVMRVTGRIYLRRYCRLTGAVKEDIERWLAPTAAARLSEWLTPHEKKRLLRFIRSEITKCGKNQAV